MDSRTIDKRSASFTLLICLILFLSMWFINVWVAPDPPKPVYGVELNFGNAKTGSGSRQPRRRVRVPKPVQPVKSEPVEQEAEESSKPVEEVVTPVEEVAAEKTQEVTTPVNSETESVVPVPEKKERKPKIKSEDKVKKKPAKTETKKTSTPKTAPSEKSEEKSSKAADEASEVETENKSQGDQAEGKKDRGNKNATKNNAKPIVYENAVSTNGNGSTAALDLTGWQWDETPRPNDQTEESGKIVFAIKIDDQGYIVDIKTVEKTISNTLEQVYRKALEDLTFSPTDDNSNPRSLTSGKITFVIKSN